jgi:hypothetical protein
MLAYFGLRFLRASCALMTSDESSRPIGVFGLEINDRIKISSEKGPFFAHCRSGEVNSPHRGMGCQVRRYWLNGILR